MMLGHRPLDACCIVNRDYFGRILFCGGLGFFPVVSFVVFAKVPIPALLDLLF